jgi:peptidoglycan/xylan/chitin deacetylase (PgdA/CDA1 family)
MIWQILCYHAIEPARQASFRAQLDHWLKAGWRFCAISAGVRHLREGQPGRFLTVTFDDGDTTAVEVAQPVLAELGIPACLYLATDYVAKGYTYRATRPRPALSWKQIEAWLAAGHELGSHSHTHAPLSRCHPSRVEQELVLSKQIIENHAGVAPRHFAFPWGQWTAAVCAIAGTLGLYETLATTDRGVNRAGPAPLLLRRDVVGPGWSPQRMDITIRLCRSPLNPLWRLQRRLRRPPGYWDRHPEEQWGPL